MMNKALVVYFSASGNTRELARRLSSVLEADLQEILPAIPYTNDDLNWMDSCSRSSIEMKNPKSRPALARPIAAESYNPIYVGFPIWWYTAPTIVHTFLEHSKLAGKTIIPFATSRGSGMGNTSTDLKVSCQGAFVKEGRVFEPRENLEVLKKWAKSF